MRCMHCGTTNDEYSRFCANCARPLAAEATTSVETTTSTEAITPEGPTGSTQAISGELPPVPPRPNTLPVTDPRLRAVPPPRRGSKLPFFFLPVGFVCGLFAVAGAFVFASNNGGAWSGALSSTGGPSTIAEVTATSTPRPAESPTIAAGGTIASPTAVPSVTSAPAQPSPTTAAGASPVVPSPTTAAAQPSPTTVAGQPSPTTAPVQASPTTAPPATTPTTAPPSPTPVPVRELKNTPGSTFQTGQTVWREGGGLTLQSTQAGIGTITNPTARLTAVFVFTNESGEPMNFPLAAGNFRVLVKGDAWRATNITATSISTADGASQSVTVTFTATGNLLQYQDVTTVNIVVDKFGPVEGVTFVARFR